MGREKAAIVWRRLRPGRDEELVVWIMPRKRPTVQRAQAEWHQRANASSSTGQAFDARARARRGSRFTVKKKGGREADNWEASLGCVELDIDKARLLAHALRWYAFHCCPHHQLEDHFTVPLRDRHVHPAEFPAAR